MTSFPTITSLECRTYITQARATPNAVSEQIAQRKAELPPHLFDLGVSMLKVQATEAQKLAEFAQLREHIK